MNSSSKNVSTPDAIDFLINDHNYLKKLFKEFESMDKDAYDLKKTAALTICDFLDVHTDIEEQIFYPKIGPAINDADMINEALVEHGASKDLMAKIREMSPEEELFDANVHVLKEQIEHHVDEEEEEMFPEVRKTSLDLLKLGEQMQARKKELESKQK